MLKSWMVLILLVLGYAMSIAEEQPVHSFSAISSPKFIGSGKRFPQCVVLTNSQEYFTALPFVHQGLWPDFCPYHLQRDPEGCSAWKQEKWRGCADLELSLYGYSHMHIDKDLVNRVCSLIDLLPINHKGKKCKEHCDYAWCRSCNQRVIRGVCCSEDDCAMEDAEDENGVDVHYYYYLKSISKPKRLVIQLL
jgi:hypothetical protein